MLTALELGERLVQLCSEGEFLTLIDEHFAADVVSVEAREGPGAPRQITGHEALKQKNAWWTENHDVHTFKAEGPFPHGDDRFAVVFEVDATAKVGPTAGERGLMREVAVYTVKDGKVGREEFFYGAG